MKACIREESPEGYIRWGRDPHSWRKPWDPRGLRACGLWAVHAPATWSPPAHQPPWGAATSGVLIWAPGAVGQIPESGFGGSDFQVKRPELPRLLPRDHPLAWASAAALRKLTASSDLGEADSPSGGPPGATGVSSHGPGLGVLKGYSAHLRSQPGPCLSRVATRRGACQSREQLWLCVLPGQEAASATQTPRRCCGFKKLGEQPLRPSPCWLGSAGRAGARNAPVAASPRGPGSPPASPALRHRLLPSPSGAHSGPHSLGHSFVRPFSSSFLRANPQPGPHRVLGGRAVAAQRGGVIHLFTIQQNFPERRCVCSTADAWADGRRDR